jgi:alpha-D-ribose 1-methylphosphonate 5-triphosphate synthase subunit PhnG
VSAAVGERVELARYTTSAGERFVFGQRVNGVVRVTDKPVGAGRSFVVERGLTSKAELDALVEDYVEQSERRDEPAALVRVGEELAELLAAGEPSHA